MLLSVKSTVTVAGDAAEVILTQLKSLPAGSTVMPEPWAVPAAVKPGGRTSLWKVTNPAGIPFLLRYAP